MDSPRGRRQAQKPSEPLEARYTNYFEVGHNAYEFIIDFGQYQPQGGAVRMQTRIVTGPVFAKLLSGLLTQAVEQFEGEHGELKQDERYGIYVQPFSGFGLRKQISNGRYPMWRRDGKEIVYYDQDRIWSVRVDTAGGELRAAAPEPLFPAAGPASRQQSTRRVARRTAILLSSAGRATEPQRDSRHGGVGSPVARVSRVGGKTLVL